MLATLYCAAVMLWCVMVVTWSWAVRVCVCVRLCVLQVNATMQLIVSPIGGALTGPCSRPSRWLVLFVCDPRRATTHWFCSRDHLNELWVLQPRFVRRPHGSCTMSNHQALCDDCTDSIGRKWLLALGNITQISYFMGGYFSTNIW